jgi:hypothetical protein
MLRLAGVALVAGAATSVHAAVAAPAPKAGKSAAPKHARRRKNLGPAGKLDVEATQKHLSDVEMVRRAAEDGRMPAEHVKLLRKAVESAKRSGGEKAQGSSNAIKFANDEVIHLIPSLTKMVQSDFDNANEAVLEATRNEQETADKLGRIDARLSMWSGMLAQSEDAVEQGEAMKAQMLQSYGDATKNWQDIQIQQWHWFIWDWIDGWFKQRSAGLWQSALSKLIVNCRKNTEGEAKVAQAAASANTAFLQQAEAAQYKQCMASQMELQQTLGELRSGMEALYQASLEKSKKERMRGNPYLHRGADADLSDVSDSQSNAHTVSFLQTASSSSSGEPIPKQCPPGGCCITSGVQCWHDVAAIAGVVGLISDEAWVFKKEAEKEWNAVQEAKTSISALETESETMDNMKKAMIATDSDRVNFRNKVVGDLTGEKEKLLAMKSEFRETINNGIMGSFAGTLQSCALSKFYYSLYTRAVKIMKDENLPTAGVRPWCNYGDWERKSKGCMSKKSKGKVAVCRLQNTFSKREVRRANDNLNQRGQIDKQSETTITEDDEAYENWEQKNVPSDPLYIKPQWMLKHNYRRKKGWYYQVPILACSGENPNKHIERREPACQEDNWCSYPCMAQAEDPTICGGSQDVCGYHTQDTTYTVLPAIGDGGCGYRRPSGNDPNKRFRLKITSPCFAGVCPEKGYCGYDLNNWMHYTDCVTQEPDGSGTQTSFRFSDSLPQKLAATKLCEGVTSEDDRVSKDGAKLSPEEALLEEESVDERFQGGEVVSAWDGEVEYLPKGATCNAMRQDGCRFKTKSCGGVVGSSFCGVGDATMTVLVDGSALAVHYTGGLEAWKAKFGDTIVSMVRNSNSKRMYRLFVSGNANDMQISKDDEPSWGVMEAGADNKWDEPAKDPYPNYCGASVDDRCDSTKMLQLATALKAPNRLPNTLSALQHVMSLLGPMESGSPHKVVVLAEGSDYFFTSMVSTWHNLIHQPAYEQTQIMVGCLHCQRDHVHQRTDRVKPWENGGPHGWLLPSFPQTLNYVSMSGRSPLGVGRHLALAACKGDALFAPLRVVNNAAKSVKQYAKMVLPETTTAEQLEESWVWEETEVDHNGDSPCEQFILNKFPATDELQYYCQGTALNEVKGLPFWNCAHKNSETKEAEAKGDKKAAKLLQASSSTAAAAEMLMAQLDEEEGGKKEDNSVYHRQKCYVYGRLNAWCPSEGAQKVEKGESGPQTVEKIWGFNQLRFEKICANNGTQAIPLGSEGK